MNQRKAGAILSYAGIALNTVVGFLFTPLLISFLGKDQYGLYQLVGSLIAYLNIMDLGLSNTTTRYYSGYKAVNDETSAENILALSGILYAGVSVLIVIVGLLLFHYFIPLKFGGGDTLQCFYGYNKCTSKIYLCQGLGAVYHFL